MNRLALPLLGPSMQVDPGFSYYKDRSPESIASEIKANGYQVVRYVLTAESNVDPTLLRAFHQQGMGVWYLTICNGVYSTKDLPANWERWRMVTRTQLEGKPPVSFFTYLCLNNPEYRAWKKQAITTLLRAQPFEGVDLAEPFWPGSSDRDDPAYGCFCDSCRTAFCRMYPEESSLPDLLHPEGPRGKTGNPALWAKWLEFRTASLTDFLDDLVNGPGGIRRSAVGAKVCVWTLTLTDRAGVERMRIDSGEDASRVARVVRPDVYGFQTNWPDWIKPDLSPNYVETFKPFFDQVRAVDPKIPLLVQADIGSRPENRRDWRWVHEFEATCKRLGVGSTTCYEYFIGGYMYSEPPRIASAESISGGQIALHFTKRVDPASAAQPASYAVSAGNVTRIAVDGSIVTLSVTGSVHRGQTVRLTVRGLQDDEKRRLFHDRPPVAMRDQTVSVRL